jgi:uncharacterized RDD family membrane protein YckC
MKGKIACVVHANREATTSCGVCGNQLCESCAIGVNGIDYCDTCAPAEAVHHATEADYERIPVLDVSKTERAAFWQRFVAFCADLGIFVGIAALIAVISGMSTGKIGFVVSPKSGPGFFIFWTLMLLIGVAYYALMLAMTGQTVGKKMTGTIVLTPEGHIIDWRTSLLRAGTAILSGAALGLGFLWALWDADKETWHDKVSKTTAFHWEEIA